MKRKIIWFIIFVIILLLFSCVKGESAKYVVVEKGDYSSKYFRLKKLEPHDTIHFNNLKLVLTHVDSIYTVLNEQNFMYNHPVQWDQFYFSTNINDTLTLTINPKKLWRKL